MKHFVNINFNTLLRLYDYDFNNDMSGEPLVKNWRLTEEEIIFNLLFM